MKQISPKDNRLFFLLPGSLVFSFIVMFFFYLIFLPPSGARLFNGEWGIESPSGKKSIEKAPFYLSGNTPGFEKGIYTFTANLTLDDAQLLELENPTIVLPYSTGNGIRLSINGVTVGCRGDLRFGRATIWNLSHVFYPSIELFEKNNNITIEIYALYEAGFTKAPFYLDTGEKIYPKLWLMLNGPRIINSFIGALFFLGLIFLGIGLFPRHIVPLRIYLGAAIVLITFSITDYSLINHFFISYLTYKKLVVGSHFLGVMFFILYMHQLAKTEGRKFVSVIVTGFLALTLCTLLFRGEMTGFRKFYQYAYFSDGVLFIYFVYLFIRRKRREKQVEMGILFLGGSVTLIFVVRDSICLFLPGGQVLLAHIGVLFLFLSGAGVVVYEIYRNFNETLRHKELVDQLYLETVMDPLTGAHNRKILKPLDAGIHSDYSVILFDLNSFKEINDSYGHEVGDLVLQEFVQIIRDQIRNNDYVIRIGGDEFIAVLPECSAVVARKQGENILRRVKHAGVKHNDDVIFFEAAMGICSSKEGKALKEIISEADRLMYLHKSDCKL